MYVNQDQARWTTPDIAREAFLTASEKKLYLKADQELEYGKIVDVIQIVKDAGIEIMVSSPR